MLPQEDSTMNRHAGVSAILFALIFSLLAKNVLQ